MKKIFTFVICLFLSVIGVTYYSQNIVPYSLSLHYDTFYSSKIPSNMDNISIIYFSDLLYGDFTSSEIIEKTFSKITELKPDILIFGGDLFDTNIAISDDSLEMLQSFFTNIDAPLGKFAVYGEKDLETLHKSKIDELYYSSNIEVLDNLNLKIGNHSKKGIHFIGLTDTNNLNLLLNSVSQDEFNIVISHKPDFLTNESFSLVSIDYALAGNSHGTQITYPVLGGYDVVSGSQTLNRSQIQPLSFPYYITSGIGCTQTRARFSAKPEICYFVIRNT